MATEPRRRDALRQYRRLMENHGMHVSEQVIRQATLTGGSVEYTAVTGYSQGDYKVTVRLEPTPRVQLVKEASSEEGARRIAEKLRDLGFEVEVDRERIHAVSKNPSLGLVNKAISVLKEERE